MAMASQSKSNPTIITRRNSMSNDSIHAHAAGTSTTMARSASMSHLPSQPTKRRTSIRFNRQVEMAIVDYVEDICPRAPRRLFYSDEDYARMKSDRHLDAQRILLEKEEREAAEQRPRHQPQLPNLKTSSYFFQQQQQQECEEVESLKEDKPDNNDYEYDNHDADSDDDQDDESICEFGIDHLICTREERNGRIRRARGVLVAVIEEQGRASEYQNDMEHRLARASLRASQMARIQAIERAAEVEEHCAKMMRRRCSTCDRHRLSAGSDDRQLPLRCSRRASCA